jgi:hypothetical protein
MVLKNVAGSKKLGRKRGRGSIIMDAENTLPNQYTNYDSCYEG